MIRNNLAISEISGCTEKIEHHSHEFQIRDLANSCRDTSSESRTMDIEYLQVRPISNLFEKWASQFCCRCDYYLLEGRKGLHRIYRNFSRE